MKNDNDGDGGDRTAVTAAKTPDHVLRLRLKVLLLSVINRNVLNNQIINMNSVLPSHGPNN